MGPGGLRMKPGHTTTESRGNDGVEEADSRDEVWSRGAGTHKSSGRTTRHPVYCNEPEAEALGPWRKQRERLVLEASLLKRGDTPTTKGAGQFGKACQGEDIL